MVAKLRSAGIRGVRPSTRRCPWSTGLPWTAAAAGHHGAGGGPGGRPSGPGSRGRTGQRGVGLRCGEDPPSADERCRQPAYSVAGLDPCFEPLAAVVRGQVGRVDPSGSGRASWTPAGPCSAGSATLGRRAPALGRQAVPGGGDGRERRGRSLLADRRGDSRHSRVPHGGAGARLVVVGLLDAGRACGQLRWSAAPWNTCARASMRGCCCWPAIWASARGLSARGSSGTARDRGIRRLAARERSLAAALRRGRQLGRTASRAMFAGTDGCGVPVLRMTLHEAAWLFALLAAGATPALARVRDAMRAHPFLVAGDERLDTRV